MNICKCLFFNTTIPGRHLGFFYVLISYFKHRKITSKTPWEWVGVLLFTLRLFLQYSKLLFFTLEYKLLRGWGLLESEERKGILGVVMYLMGECALCAPLCFVGLFKYYSNHDHRLPKIYNAINLSISCVYLRRL